MAIAQPVLAERSAQAAEEAGESQARAATEAAQLVQQRFETSRQDLAPFREAATSVALPELIELATSPQADRYSQIKDSPIFKAMLNVRDRDTAGRLANQGRIGTGDASAQFAENVLLSALPLIDINVRDEQIREQRLNNILSSGQASAAMTGQQGIQSAQIQGNLSTDAAAAAAAGRIGKEQARQQGLNNLFSNITGAFTGGFL